MEIELRPPADAAVLAAVRQAAMLADLVEEGGAASDASAWRHAALEEGVGGDPVTNRAQAPSPRSTRGATRA